MDERKLLESVQAFAIDLDGTTWLGNRLLPGAIELKKALDKIGLQVVFVTNNSSMGALDYVAKMNALGLDAGPSNILTSGQATILFLKRDRQKARVFLVGTGSLRREFQEAGVQLVHRPSQADTLVLGFDTRITYKRLREVCDLVRKDTFFIATHPDLVCPTPKGPVPDVGSFLALVEAATGKRPHEVCGKPSSRMVQALCERLGKPPERIAFVGDRLYTDVRMARESGMVSVLVLSGETKPEDIPTSPYRPSLIVQGLLELKDLLEQVAQRSN